ncbi:hypothetical protein J1N35_017671 [Gossypium stocksii]|uniref:Reverse transcriptase n=1 Tax=Gossypium stocksii TaxID=47602 RepID=A0A9D4A5F3_9ROSI|nr:hypothetical protein J1N35_017671 [Gossypium stocksii]
MRSLNNIQRTLDLCSSTHLVKKELDIRDELENVLDHKDLLWRQKVRCDWLRLGDRNTKFFHCRTLRRRKFNRITTLHIDNGDWCSDNDILQSKVVEFFKRLYGEDPPVLRDIPNVGFPSFNPSETTFLEAAITNEEIKRVLFDMAPLKAPRSDGFHAHFFQSQWDIIGNDVFQLDQTRLLDNILTQFCEISGHKISVRKNNIFFSKNTEVDVCIQFSQLFEFQEVWNLGTYLGVHVLHDRVTKSTLSFIVDKVRKKLQSWDGRKLSIVERITLAQSVLLSIPNYFMQSLLISKGVNADIERLVR